MRRSPPALLRLPGAGRQGAAHGGRGVPLCALRDHPDLYDVYAFNPKARSSGAATRPAPRLPGAPCARSAPASCRRTPRRTPRPASRLTRAAATHVRAAHDAAPGVDGRAARRGVAGRDPGAAADGELQPGLHLLQRQRDVGERVDEPRRDAARDRPRGAPWHRSRLVLRRRADAVEPSRRVRPLRGAPRRPQDRDRLQRGAARREEKVRRSPRPGSPMRSSRCTRTTRSCRANRRRRSATSRVRCRGSSISSAPASRPPSTTSSRRATTPTCATTSSSSTASSAARCTSRSPSSRRSSKPSTTSR